MLFALLRSICIDIISLQAVAQKTKMSATTGPVDKRTSHPV